MLYYDDFGFAVEQEPEIISDPPVPIREQFPEAGASYMGGESDGWEYRTAFAGTKLAHSYEMVKQFLREEGYGDIPLPETAAELRLFRVPKRLQLQLFEENGYVHNPIRILFHPDPRQRNTLVLCIYNEKAERHLLRFHGK